LPVPGKTAQEIAARAKLYERLAQLQLSHPDFRDLNLTIASGSANILAECYFALSEAYKGEVNEAGSRTEWIKSAAIICNGCKRG
jgi:hypothetical protein